MVASLFYSRGRGGDFFDWASTINLSTSPLAQRRKNSYTSHLPPLSQILILAANVPIIIIIVPDACGDFFSLDVHEEMDTHQHAQEVAHLGPYVNPRACPRLGSRRSASPDRRRRRWARGPATEIIIPTCLCALVVSIWPAGRSHRRRTTSSQMGFSP